MEWILMLMGFMGKFGFRGRRRFQDAISSRTFESIDIWMQQSSLILFIGFLPREARVELDL